jgi:hypothetical protein
VVDEGLTAREPEVALAPDQPPDAVHELALADDQLSVDDWPAVMLAGDADSDTVGADGGAGGLPGGAGGLPGGAGALPGGAGALPSPPAGDSLSAPPHAASTSAETKTSSRCLARKVGLSGRDAHEPPS